MPKVTSITVEFVDETDPTLKMSKMINIGDLNTQEEIDARIAQHENTFRHRISIGSIKPADTLVDTTPVDPTQDPTV
jgi:hypothetical protein